MEQKEHANGPDAVLGIKEFNQNTPSHLASVDESGKPLTIVHGKRADAEYVSVVPTALLNRLLDLCGGEGRRVAEQFAQERQSRQMEFDLRRVG